MELDLVGRRAVVLASSDGIGKAIASALAREGTHVAISGRDEMKLESARAEVAAAAHAGTQVIARATDVTKAADIASLVDAAASAFGGIDILVTNCGGPKAGPLLSFDDETWGEMFDLTLRSVARACRAALPHLQASDQGRIICIASSSVAAAIPTLGFSNVFRPGIHGLVKTLAAELGPEGITVNLIAPGKIDTARVRSLDENRGKAAGTSGEELRRTMETEIPLRRYGRPDELAELATFLCSRAGGYVSGTAQLVDGGFVNAL